MWVTTGGVWVTEGGVWVTKGVYFYPYPKLIVNNKIATRKWILGQLDDEIVETGGWGEIGQ